MGSFRKLIFIVACIPVILFFQNCGEGFQAQTSRVVDLGSAQPLTQPTLEWKSAPIALTNKPSFVLEFTFKLHPTLKLSSLMCRIDSMPPVDCKNGKFPLNSLTDGDHVLSVTLVDTAAQVAKLEAQVRIDTVAPVLTITEKPASVIGSATANFAFLATDLLADQNSIGFQCQIDTEAWKDCVSPLAYSGLAPGDHVFNIRAYDQALNISNIQSVNFRVDLTAPNLVIAQKPAAYINTKATTLGFTASQQGTALTDFQCRTDAAAFATCTSPVNLANLTDGAHTFAVRVKGSNGTYSQPQSIQWTVDTGAPTVPVITTTTGSYSNSRSASFLFVSTDTGSAIHSFECALNQGSFAVCVSGVQYQNLTSGAQTFQVRSVDLAGNRSAPSTQSWIGDYAVPEIQWVQTPSISSISTQAEFSFTSTDGGSGILTQQCSLDASAFAACANMLVYTNLNEGAHVFTVKVTDKASNVKQLSYSWTIEPTPVDGKTLYANNCSACHGMLATSTKANRTADQIKNALASVTQMKTIKLSDAQVALIAQALKNTIMGPITAEAAALKYFPELSVTRPAKRTFRLTRDQLDATVKSVFPAYTLDALKSTLPPDPTITNYEFAEVLKFTNSNFIPLDAWLTKLVSQVKANPYGVVDCRASNNSQGCLSTQARSFITKAYRADVTEQKITEFLNFYTTSVASVGIEEATADLVDVVVSSPQFLFREEFEVNSSSSLVPAEHLQLLTYTFADAPAEKLGLNSSTATTHLQATNKEATINSILLSSSGREKLSRFVLAWLEVKEAADYSISTTIYPEFTPAVATSAVTETKRFLASVSNKAAPSLKDLTHAKQSYIDANMARIYGVTTPDNSGNTLVTLNPNERLGIFSQAAVIASHSGPDSSRLVKRGAFFARKVLCIPIEGTPPNVNTNLPTGNSMTQRQKVESVTNNSSCLGCHSTLNPMGSFQENYSASGKWRTLDNGLPIDASISYNDLDEGILNSNNPIETIDQLTTSMMFKQCFIRQMFRFYMGRNETKDDDQLLKAMFLGFTANDSQDILAPLKILANAARTTQR